jgi:hypothetical protein
MECGFGGCSASEAERKSSADFKELFKLGKPVSDLAIVVPSSRLLLVKSFVQMLIHQNVESLHSIFPSVQSYYSSVSQTSRPVAPSNVSALRELAEIALDDLVSLDVRTDAFDQVNCISTAACYSCAAPPLSVLA